MLLTVSLAVTVDCHVTGLVREDSICLAETVSPHTQVTIDIGFCVTVSSGLGDCSLPSFLLYHFSWLIFHLEEYGSCSVQ